MPSQRHRLLALGLTWVITATVLRVTLLAPEDCPPLDADGAMAAAEAGADWIVRNQSPDGRYLYQYDRATGVVPDDYNIVRHAGTTMALYQLVAAGREVYLAPADAATAYMLERMIDTDEGAAGWAEEPEDDPRLGAAALMAVSLLIRRQATGDDRHDDVLRRLGRFMVGQQRDDGVMYDAWLQAEGAPDPSVRSRYATGEALWAIAMLHETFPDEGWDEPAWRTLDYLALRRDVEEGLFPRPWPDQWAAYSLSAMSDWPLEAHHVDYARSLAGAFGVQVRWDAQRSGVGTLTHPPAPRGAGFGTVVEALGSLLTVAETDPRAADLAEPLAERLACAGARLASWQTGPDDVVSSPERELGAWFRDDVTRVDDQQHAASGLLESVRVLPGGGE